MELLGVLMNLENSLKCKIKESQIKGEAFEMFCLMKLLDSLCSIVGGRRKLWIIFMCIDIQEKN